MKPKLRLFSLALVFLMLFSTLCACGQDQPTSSAQSPSTQSPTAQSPSAQPPGSQPPDAQPSDNESATGLTEKINIRFAHDFWPGHASYEGVELYKAEVESRSGGMITVDVFHSGELSGQNSQVTFQMLQTGDIDMTLITPPNTDEWQLFFLPFMFRNSKEALAACEEEGGQMLLSLLRENNVEGLSFFDVGMKNFTNSVHPLEEPEDLNGLRIRVFDTPGLVAFMQELGANPVPMSMGELYMGLQQKTVDGQEITLTTIYTSAFYEVQDYLTITNHLWSFNICGANAAFWDGLPEEAQKILREAAVEIARQVADISPLYVQEAYDNLKEHMEVNELSDEQWLRWQAAVMPVHQKMEPVITSEILDAFYNSLGITKTW